MTPLDLQTIAQALGGEVSGGQVLAPGPDHTLVDRSLSVMPSSDGKDVIVHSFAGDDPLRCKDYVRERLGMEPWKPGQKPKAATVNSAIHVNGGGKMIDLSLARPWYETWDIDGNLLPNALKRKPKPAANGHKADQTEWTSIAPVPETAPPLTIDRINQLAPAGYEQVNGWPYRDAEGKLLCYVARFEREGNPKDKIFLPLTFCKSASNQLGEWRSKALPAPRPLYNLDKLAERSDVPVIVTEGEKSADAAASLFPDAVVITSSGGAQAASKTDWSPIRGHNVTIWRDNDEPGKKYAADVVKLARAAGAQSVRVVDLPSSFEHGWDLANEPPQGVTQDDLRRMLVEAREAPAEAAAAEAETEADAAAEQKGFAYVRYENLQININKDWIIKGVVARRETSSWIAPPGKGKSALLTEIAVHVAAGLDWRGYRSKQQAAVVCFALERGDLLRRRFEAYKRKHELHNLPIVIVTATVNIMSPDCIPSIVATIRDVERHYGQEVGLIILDTFAKAIAAGGGDEDKAKDQNRALGHLRDVQNQTGVHVAFVGHTGKDESRGSRGSNAHLGDVDLLVQISGDDVKAAEIIKANDQPEGPLTSFSLESYHLGEDEDGDAITVGIVSDEVPETTERKEGSAKPSAKDRIALVALRRAIEDAGESPPASNHIPQTVKVVTKELWRQYAYQSSPEDNPETRKKAFQRAFERLQDSKLIGFWDPYVWTIHP